ncbi:MAG: Esa1p-associated factor [Chrysothrix sp. TS-e1954]|nr:MAG: Esa1p-associated factor [Chrysothrix sp. TS-e1954]
MAPKAVFSQGESCFCFHGPILYEAKIEGIRKSDKKDVHWEYYLHYKGWKKTWDEWVEEKDVYKNNEENQQWAKDLKGYILKTNREEEKQKKLDKASAKSRKSTGAVGGSEQDSSLRGSEERGSSVVRGTKRARDHEHLEREDDFHRRPSIRMPMPDNLKGLLVDDWENVTKSNQLVPIPHTHSIEQLLSDYQQHEGPRRRQGSADHDILAEVIQGVLEYFDKSLGRILLYRFERQQWLDIHERMMLSKDAAEKTGDEVNIKVAGKSPSQVYGAEHLCRLLVSMPELVAQTNMDSQSVNRLREELFKMTSWLSKNSSKYFTKDYETAGRSYEDKTRGPVQ